MLASDILCAVGVLGVFRMFLNVAVNISYKIAFHHTIEKINKKLAYFDPLSVLHSAAIFSACI